MSPLRSSIHCLRAIEKPQQTRCLSTATSPATSPFAPRHLLSIGDLSSTELTTLVRNASAFKKSIKSGAVPRSLAGALSG